MEASVGPRAVLLGEVIDLDVDKLPLDEPPDDDGDDESAHAANNGAVDEAQALLDEMAEQEALDLDDLEPDNNIDGLSIKRLRARAVRSALLGYRHTAQVHYTQGARRWDGISNRCRAHLGRFPRWADCSSYVTWCLWDALGGPNAGQDIINGASWSGGYTGTLKAHGRRVSGGIANAKRGDLVHYGPGSGKHVTIVVGKNKVISHGSPGSGPKLLKPNYRTDVSEVRRYFG